MSSGLAILDFTHEDLQRVELKMREMCEGAFGPLGEAFLHLIGSGGKRLRPALALMAYRFYAADGPDRIIALAAAVETLHTATLVHDDLIDGALMRRGKTTLNAQWSKGATVLGGDYLFARSAGFAAETGSLQVVQIFADTLRIICDGELRQMFANGQWQIPKESYYRRIFAKTASLFAAAARMGAILADAPAAAEQALYDYGYHLGMAFQIVDDILDFVGDEAVLGKPVGSDLRQGTVTLPFYYFLEAHPEPESVAMLLEADHERRAGHVPAGPDGRSGGIDRLVRMVGQDARAITAARQEASDFAQEAKQRLDGLPAGELRQALADLADFVVARDT
jgi:geranylgeranyl pyrophosphate synthase